MNGNPGTTGRTRPHWPVWLMTFGLTLLSTGFAARTLAAQRVPQANPGWMAALPKVAATVGGKAVSARRVIQHLERTVPGFRQFERTAQERLLAEALEHLVRRELVLGQLLAAGDAPGQSAVKLERGKLEAELAARGETLAGHIARTGLSDSEFDHELLWKLAWEQRLEAELSDEAAAAWYDKHYFRFDGSTLRVDQILWQWPDPADEAEKARLRAEAAGVADRLRRNELEWSVAVRRYSMSPLARLPERPDMGWIGYHGPMPEAFAAAAFALHPGEVSLPVETGVGLHVIRRLELKRGERTFAESEAEVRAAMMQDLFDRLAESPTGNTEIVRSPGFPLSSRPAPAREDGG